MKDFVKESLALLGAKIRPASSADCLFVRIPLHSPIGDFLKPETEHLLSFAGNEEVPGIVKVRQGSRFVDQLGNLLSIHSARHGLLPDKARFSRKDIRSKFSVFSGEVTSFSIKNSWRTTLRCYFKITVTGDELYEDLIMVEIPFQGQPMVTEDEFVPPEETLWAQKPPLRQYEFKDLLEKGYRSASIMAIARAEDLRKKNIIRLHTRLECIRNYYQQLRLETSGDKSVVDGEYQRRKQETVQQAGIRTRIEIIAVETLSTPVKTAKWTVEKNSLCKDVTVELNSYNGSTIRPVHCNICNRGTEIFGITNENFTVCPDCVAVCEFCGKEVIEEHAKKQWVCKECARPVCVKHSSICHVCRSRMCSEHLHDCQHKGCKVCTSCIRHCVECGNDIIWCPDHTTVHPHGIVICKEHSVYCIGCRETCPSGIIETCAYCGQTVCPNCRIVCADCKKNFCLNHVHKGRCDECNMKKENEESGCQKNLF